MVCSMGGIGMQQVSVETAIIGAGPAGLAAAQVLRGADVLVLEAGPVVGDRSQEDPATLLEGVGGAGLYSDGKFSFWPSATVVWELDPRLLDKARRSLDGLLTRHGIDVASIGDATASILPTTIMHTRFDKHYPSIYVPLDVRARMISELSSGVDILTASRVSRIAARSPGWMLHGETHGDGLRVICKNLVIAAGRYGSLLVQDCLPQRAQTPIRVEVGVRIEQPAEHFFLKNHPRLDPKLIYRSSDRSIEWRTFCCCRNGAVVTGRSYGIESVSGHADGPPTAHSNVGFNVRILDRRSIEAEWPRMRERLTRTHAPVQSKLGSLLDERTRLPSETAMLAEVLGRAMSARLSAGLAALVQDFPEGRLEQASIAGPTVEGVGMYLRHDSRLKTPLPGLWVAGDSAGDFRGLTAALISGYVVGNAVLRPSDGVDE